MTLSSLPTRVPRRRLFHVPEGTAYHIEDSLRGVLWAIKKHFGWIDLDVHRSLDGTLYVTHWSRPGEHDGFRMPNDAHWNRHKSISLMHDSEVERLRTPDGYRIRKAIDLIPWAVTHGIKVEFEAKENGFTVYDFLRLREAIQKAGGDPKHVQVKAFGKFRRSLSGARRAGFITILLVHTRGEAYPVADADYVTYYRGFPPEWR